MWIGHPNGQPTGIHMTTENKGHRYAVGHPYYPPKYPGVSSARPKGKRPSIKQRRQIIIDNLGDMLEKMAARHQAGEPVDPVEFATVVNTFQRVHAEM